MKGRILIMMIITSSQWCKLALSLAMWGDYSSHVILSYNLSAFHNQWIELIFFNLAFSNFILTFCISLMGILTDLKSFAFYPQIFSTLAPLQTLFSLLWMLSSHHFTYLIPIRILKQSLSLLFLIKPPNLVCWDYFPFSNHWLITCKLSLIPNFLGWIIWLTLKWISDSPKASFLTYPSFWYIRVFFYSFSSLLLSGQEALEVMSKWRNRI